MIYLDNAATSFPKPETVSKAAYECMLRYCANPGRSGHSLSMEAGKAVFKAREVISDFFNIPDPLQLVFTKNATEAINIALKGYLKPYDHVITTSMEHNSVVRPLKTLERDRRIRLTFVKGNKFGEIDPKDIIKNIRKSTSLIVSTLSSNVNGIVMPVDDIGCISKSKGIPFLLDASQGAGSLEIDVQMQNIDMLAFPGHKGMMGPQGTGGLYINKDIKLRTIFEGGTGSNSESMYQPEFMPDYMESGTLNTPGIVGLCKGVEYINAVGIEKIREHRFKLVKRLLEGIGEIKGARLYSIPDKERNSGIAAINVDGFDSTELSQILDKECKIAVRAGFHCAPLAHRTLGTSKTGVVRFSPGCFNTLVEMDSVINAIKNLQKI